jgi:hypothetical protein
MNKIYLALNEVTEIVVCPMADDRKIFEAFERLLKEPAFSKINLTDWEFRLAADAPGIYTKFGGFTWKQRRALRQIMKKIMNYDEIV